MPSLWSQIELDQVWDNDFKVRYLKTDKWKATVSFGKRADIKRLTGGTDDDNNSRLDFDFAEIKHELTYEIDKQYDIGLETRFRYKTLFTDETENEIRVSPYVIYSNSKNKVENSYELKVEFRRFQDSFKYRVRLGHESEKPFASQVEKDNPLKWFYGTTVLSQFEGDERTEIELRNHLGIDVSLWKRTSASLAVQLRSEYDFDDIAFSLFYKTALGYKF